jgi:hypothetical protein
MPRGKFCQGARAAGAVTAERAHPPVDRPAAPELIAWIMQIMQSI